MDEVKIFWTFTAKDQRDQIFHFWNKRNGNGNYSKKLNLEIRKRIDLLKKNPEMGKESNFGETRILTLNHYSILYKTALPKIFITGFWDNRRDPAKLLRHLKKH